MASTESRLGKLAESGWPRTGARSGAEACPVIRAFRRAPEWAVRGQDPRGLILQRRNSKTLKTRGQGTRAPFNFTKGTPGSAAASRKSDVLQTPVPSRI